VAQASNGSAEPIPRRAGSCACADRVSAQRRTSLSKVASRRHATGPLGAQSLPRLLRGARRRAGRSGSVARQPWKRATPSAQVESPGPVPNGCPTFSSRQRPDSQCGVYRYRDGAAPCPESAGSSVAHSMATPASSAATCEIGVTCCAEVGIRAPDDALNVGDSSRASGFQQGRAQRMACERSRGGTGPPECHAAIGL
jgi:hypothetical protein